MSTRRPDMGIVVRDTGGGGGRPLVAYVSFMMS